MQLVDLGSTPLANEFVTASQRGTEQKRYPLVLNLCSSCGHVQLRDVVEADLLFRDYVYVSSTSPVFVDHFRRYAEFVMAHTSIAPGAQVLEIGSNDGVLLRFFKDAGMRVLGVDPARAIAGRATADGIETIPDFFDERLAEDLADRHGSFAVIAANNVLAHADDLHGIVRGVARVLAKDGVFVCEVSYLLDVVRNKLFDTIYHEHVSYHTLRSLSDLLRPHGLQVVEAMRVPTHGGSLRVVAQLRAPGARVSKNVSNILHEEETLGLQHPAPYKQMFEEVRELGARLQAVIQDLRRQREKVVGFGAPAKATTLMFHFGMSRTTFDYIVDDSPLKQGLYSPGLHIPIVPSSHLYDAEHVPDYVVVLAWNFADSIVRNHQRFRDNGGHFIVPLPTLVVH
jgi:SAM-dependent methyltransferase